MGQGRQDVHGERMGPGGEPLTRVCPECGEADWLPEKRCHNDFHSDLERLADQVRRKYNV